MVLLGDTFICLSILQTYPVLMEPKVHFRSQVEPGVPHKKSSHEFLQQNLSKLYQNIFDIKVFLRKLFEIS